MAQLTMEQIGPKLRRWIELAPKEAKTALLRELHGVMNVILAEHLSGPRMAKNVGHPTLATLASPTSTLKKSVFAVANVRAKKLTGGVGARAFYGEGHEKGLWGLPARPFVRPSIEKRKPNIAAGILKAIMAWYRRAR